MNWYQKKLDDEEDEESILRESTQDVLHGQIYSFKELLISNVSRWMESEVAKTTGMDGKIIQTPFIKKQIAFEIWYGSMKDVMEDLNDYSGYWWVRKMVAKSCLVTWLGKDFATLKYFIGGFRGTALMMLMSSGVINNQETCKEAYLWICQFRDELGINSMSKLDAPTLSEMIKEKMNKK